MERNIDQDQMEDNTTFLDDQLNQDEKPYQSAEAVDGVSNIKPTAADTTMSSHQEIKIDGKAVQPQEDMPNQLEELS